MSNTHRRSVKRPIIRRAILGLVALSLPACSPKLVAVNILGDALAGGGGVYASDEDPDLIREAIPFGLKTYEALLDVSPDHRGLLLSAASGFTAYAYLIQDESDRMDAVDLPRARVLRARANRLYLRGRDYALRGLEVQYPGFTAKLRQDPSSALTLTTVEDVPYLYWSGASWAGALTAAKDDLHLLADLPMSGALVGRVLELDESYERGAAHEFFIAYEGGRPGGSASCAREHYRRALEISGGQRASVHLALAEGVVIREQNLEEFRALIMAALAVDPDRVLSLRLANTIARRRARWLETRIPELFVETNGEEEVE
ncbi:MAG TPA: TRAP transporter TatT component family protein [Candidatus Methylomirabilis sp.]|nr:TRAP transporter TatT component family protein [Candidatus Methylomirabilis sp.]HSD52481.1 TRAP transporter TatT component family protein [Candidatus Methylomirabilis sp.]